MNLDKIYYEELILIKNLYCLEFKSDTRAIVKLANENHTVFKAHFPSNPILPGFVNFDIVADVFDLKIKTIKKAKFLKTVKPNQTLIYERDGNKFKVLCENEEIASFSL